MKTIDLELWEPDPEKPGIMKYVGQPVAKEVFEELRSRLEAAGMMPDEYFLLNLLWEDGRIIPKGAFLFCSTDYGESEGIYVDVYLKWFQEGHPVIESFATGKTLGETGYDLDRMFLIAAEITKAFSVYGYHNETAEGVILHLDHEEKAALLEVLSGMEKDEVLAGIYQKARGNEREFSREELQVDGEPEIEEDGKTITACLETWFDVDRKFGLHTRDEDTWVNLYARYTPSEDRLSMFYIVCGRANEQCSSYLPTPNEEKLVKELIREKLREQYGQTPEEFLREASEEPEEEMGGVRL